MRVISQPVKKNKKKCQAFVLRAVKKNFLTTLYLKLASCRGRCFSACRTDNCPFHAVTWSQYILGCIWHLCCLLSTKSSELLSIDHFSKHVACFLDAIPNVPTSFCKGYFPGWAKSSIWSLTAAEQREVAATSQDVSVVSSKPVPWWSLQKLCAIDPWLVCSPLYFRCLGGTAASPFYSTFVFVDFLPAKQSTMLLTILGICWLWNNHKQGHSAKFWVGVTVFSASRPWCSSRKIKVFTDTLWISTLVASPL